MRVRGRGGSVGTRPSAPSITTGTSGAPVVMRRAVGGDLPWSLLGVHSSRMDMGGRDLTQDESLGLNCAWYADILNTLTA